MSGNRKPQVEVLEYGLLEIEALRARWLRAAGVGFGRFMMGVRG